MTDTLNWTLVLLQIAMGAFDTLYHHVMTERLAWRESQARELRLHAVRGARPVNLRIGLVLDRAGCSVEHVPRQAKDLENRTGRCHCPIAQTRAARRGGGAGGSIPARPPLHSLSRCTLPRMA
jgi:hypothetical protein